MTDAEPKMTEEGKAVARNDLDKRKDCMYRAISSGLDYFPLPPEKISVALAAVIHEYLGKDAADTERFIEALVHCTEQRTGQ